MKKNYHLIIAILFVIFGFFIGTNLAKADNPSVIINEFVSNPDSGSEWVELLNTTGADISLVGWKITELTTPTGTPSEVDWNTLSGSISANGVLVFEVSGSNLNNPGDSIGLYDSELNLVQRVTYGNVASPYTADLTAPSSGKSGAYIDGAWQTDQTPTKGELNSEPSGDPVAEAFDTISSTLTSNGIVNNMNDVTGANITSFSDLYFEKRTDVNDATTALGRITFNSALDLSNDDTKTFLQNLGTKMDASTAGQIGLDFRGTTDSVTLKGVSATIKFYNLDDLGFDADSTVDEINSKLIALDDDGNVIDKSTLISDSISPTYLGACEVGGGCYVFTVPVNHFTKYKIDEVGETTPNESGQATLSGDTKEVVVTNPTQAVTVSVASGATDSKINVSAFITGGTGTLPAINITSANANNATVAIPASTVVTSADITWDGVIATPTVTTVTLPETSDETNTLSTAIEVGFTGAKLTFDKAVRILLPNQAGKKVGYVRTGITFTEITNICGADDQATGDALIAEGDCKIDVGSDLVIWTKHFTSFATYSTTSNGSGSSSNSSGSSIIIVAPIIPIIATSDGCAPGNLFNTTTGEACVEEVVVNNYEGCDNRDYGFSTMTGKTCMGNPDVLDRPVLKKVTKTFPKITEVEPIETPSELIEIPADKETFENNLSASAGTVSSTITRSSALWALLIIAIGLGIGYGSYSFKRNKKLDKIIK